MLANAFRLLLNLHSRKVKLERPGEIAAVDVKVSPSNYFRNLSGPEETVIEGREFVISKKCLDDAGFPHPERGDRLKDPETGTSVISEVREMYGFGGAILGYRIRTS